MGVLDGPDESSGARALSLLGALILLDSLEHAGPSATDAAIHAKAVDPGHISPWRLAAKQRQGTNIRLCLHSDCVELPQPLLSPLLQSKHPRTRAEQVSAVLGCMEVSRWSQAGLQEQQKMRKCCSKVRPVQARYSIVWGGSEHLFAARAVHLDDLDPQVVAETDWQHWKILARDIGTVPEFQILILVELHAGGQRDEHAQQHHGQPFPPATKSSNSKSLMEQLPTKMHCGNNG